MFTSSLGVLYLKPALDFCLSVFVAVSLTGVHPVKASFPACTALWN